MKYPNSLSSQRLSRRKGTRPELLQQGVLVRETAQEEHSCHSRPVTTAALSSEKELLDQFRHCLTSLSKTSTLSLA
ncbi:unnamed protein product [Rhizophagus irregularis]|nr:unnamed protein product [Rhizophagus irregularis]